MKLIELSSSNPMFRPLRFNPGLNIVLGKKVSEDDTDTYNSVGKSLALELIHFMLAHNFSLCLNKNLSEYEFTLTFQHGSKDYEIKRRPLQKNVLLNNEPIPVEDLKAYLFKKLLVSEDLELRRNGITSFRSLFNRFARLSRDAYVSVIKQLGKGENGFENNLYNAFLLGLETGYITKKKEISREKEGIKLIKKELEKFDSVEKSELLDIEDEIKQIENVLSNFRIARNYSELVGKADKLTEEINVLDNSSFINEKKIETKKKSLQETPDIPVSVIKKLWEETDYFFEEKVEKELYQVEEFHKTLIKNRRSRFVREIQELEIANKDIKEKRDNLDIERAEIMGIIKRSGALDEYETLRDRLENLRRKKANLSRYDGLKKELQGKEVELNSKSAENHKYAVEYLASKEQDIKKIKELFREIARNFYHQHPGSIDIEINTNPRANKIFDIEPHIDEDGGDGIGEVKIFCYDLLIHRLNPDLFSFMAHDSRLFANMDERQRAKALILAHNEHKKSGLQYFCSLNQDNFDTALAVMEQAEKNIMLDAVILELTDEDSSKKLFGKKFNC